MNYFVTRNGQEYGPYTLGDLQRYVAAGDILVSDMARSEGMSESLPVSRIIGTIPVPVMATPSPVAPNMPDFRDPPNLHWGLLLLFSVLSCGLFSIAWDLVQAAWMRQVEPRSRALYYYAVAVAAVICFWVLSFQSGFNHQPSQNAGVKAILEIAYTILFIVGRFSLRDSLEEHFNSAEPIGLSLSGVMTFFFGGLYFQYHLNEIMRRKNMVRMGVYTA